MTEPQSTYFPRDKTGLVCLPTQLERVHCNFTGDGKCNKRGWGLREKYKHYFAKDGNVILPTDWSANKLGETSMRALCHLDKNSNAAPAL